MLAMVAVGGGVFGCLRQSVGGRSMSSSPLWTGASVEGAFVDAGVMAWGAQSSRPKFQPHFPNFVMDAYSAGERVGINSYGAYSTLPQHQLTQATTLLQKMAVTLPKRRPEPALTVTMCVLFLIAISESTMTSNAVLNNTFPLLPMVIIALCSLGGTVLLQDSPTSPCSSDPIDDA